MVGHSNQLVNSITDTVPEPQEGRLLVAAYNVFFALMSWSRLKRGRFCSKEHVRVSCLSFTRSHMHAWKASATSKVVD